MMARVAPMRYCGRLGRIWKRTRREAPKVIGWMVELSLCVMLFVTGIAGITCGLMKSDSRNVFIGIVFTTAGGTTLGYGVVLKAINETRRLLTIARRLLNPCTRPDTRNPCSSPPMS